MKSFVESAVAICGRFDVLVNAACASKSGLLGLTRCVALEVATHGVSCVMTCPTRVETELMQRNVAQVVALAALPCSDEAKGFAAENIQITGGALW